VCVRARALLHGIQFIINIHLIETHEVQSLTNYHRSLINVY